MMQMPLRKDPAEGNKRNMKNPYHRIWAEIDLDALRFNMESMRKRLPARMRMAGVVKADAYGHGAVPVAKEIGPYVSYYCVATEEEALNLRLHGIRKPILMLGPLPGDDYEAVVREEIRPAVFTMEQAEAVSRAAIHQKKTASVHIALDTGMNRVGMKPTEESADLVKRIAALPGIYIEGLFTHLYRADERDLTTAREQVERFHRFIGFLSARGVNPEICHVANSAGIMELLGSEFDMSRAGITMYGIYPSDEVDRSLLPLKPVMSLHSVITYVKEIAAGDEVSYGGTFRASRAMRVATIPAGYGDGYPRMLGSRAWVLIAGKRAPILGRVCMDQFMVDVDGIPEAAAGTPVTLLGSDGGETLSVDELSSLCGRFPYEFVCCVGRRVPRVYVRNGEIIGTKDWFGDLYEDFR